MKGPHWLRLFPVENDRDWRWVPRCGKKFQAFLILTRGLLLFGFPICLLFLEYSPRFITRFFVRSRPEAHRDHSPWEDWLAAASNGPFDLLTLRSTVSAIFLSQRSFNFKAFFTEQCAQLSINRSRSFEETNVSHKGSGCYSWWTLMFDLTSLPPPIPPLTSSFPVNSFSS